MRIEVHSKEGCPWCDKAKAWLLARGHAYVEIRHDDIEERQRFYDGLGLQNTARTMPQIIVVDGDEVLRIGGYDRLDASGL